MLSINTDKMIYYHIILFYLYIMANNNFLPDIFPIPNQEPEYHENHTGTNEIPWLFKISEGQRVSASLIFHRKIGDKYYNYVLYREYKKKGQWSIRN